MKKILPFFMIIFFLNCSAGTRKPEIYYAKSKYKINPYKKSKLTYKALLNMDKNKDGFINAKDRENNTVFNTKEKIINAYIDYLNRDYAHDLKYSRFLQTDINKNNVIERFEKRLELLKTQNKKTLYLKKLNEAYNRKRVSLYQYLNAKFVLYNYYGKIQNTIATGKQIATKFPNSNYSLFLNNSGKTSIITSYNFKNKATRYLSEILISSPLVTALKSKAGSFKKILINSPALFPSMFYSRSFMLAIISKLQSNLFTFKDKLKKNKNKNSATIKSIDSSFNNLDIIYAFITGLKNVESFHFNIVARYKRLISKYLKSTRLQIKNYNSALNFIKRVIRKYKIQKTNYHFLIAALFKSEIKNKKPIKETDFSFSPDLMFKKGYGVCADQSLVFNIFMKDLLKINAGNIYLWFRKNYWNHLSMIYKNFDGKYYVFDNYGINRLVFTNFEDAIRFHCVSSIKYIASKKIDKNAAINKSWHKVETQKTRYLSTMDGKYRIVFGETKKCINFRK